MANDRALLISPRFHGYWKPIARAMSMYGFDVTPVLPDDYRGIGAKLRRKAIVDAPTALGADRSAVLTRWATQRALEALREVRPHRVLVIRGDDLSSSFFDEVDRAGVPVGLWLYDELRRTAHSAESLSRFDFVATYSAADANALVSDGFDAAHLPLGFDDHAPYVPLRQNAIVFIGARYPERERLLAGLHQSDVAVHAYGRDWSNRFVDRARTLSWSRPDVPSSADVDRVAAYGIMAGADASLNVHGDQDGFTMRTFEAPGVGSLQLIDRRDVSDLYEPDVEVLVFADDLELIDLAQRATMDRRWAESIAAAGRKRTLAEHTIGLRIERLVSLWS